GQQDESTGESLAAEITVEEHRQPQPERQLEDGGHASIDEGVVDRGAKDSVVEYLVEVGEADELAGHTYARVGHRQQNTANERIGNEHTEQHQGRHQQHECEPTLVLEQPEPGPRRLWHVDLSLSDRHFASPRCARHAATTLLPPGPRESIFKHRPSLVRLAPTLRHPPPACLGPLLRTCR